MIEVLTYDVSCNVLKKSFQFVSEDLGGNVLAVAPAKAIGTAWGARLKWAARKVDTYCVVVTDTQMNYTTLVIGDFNAAGGGKFEVIMKKLPPAGTISGGGGGGGGWGGSGDTPDDNSTLGKIRKQIADQPNWSEEEKEGALTLVRSYIAVSEHPAVQKFVAKWETKLESLGVSVASLKTSASKRASATFTV